MRCCTRWVESVTVLVSAVIGGLALATPVSLAWARGGTATVQIELLATNMLRAAAIGCIAGVVVAVFASTAESMIVPWAGAMFGMVLLLLNHLLGRSLSSIAPLTTLNYIDTMAGGILLGGIAAAAGVRMAMTLAFVLGALLSVVIGELSAFSGMDGSARGPASWFVDSPPLWLIWPATALIAWCALRYRQARRYSTLTVELPLSPILAAVVAVSVPVLGSEWMVRHGTTGGDIWLVTGASILAALVAGLLLPGRDGMLLQTSVAIGSVGSVIVPIPLAAWMVPISLLGDVAGLWFGLRRPAPVFGMLALLVLSAIGALAATPGHALPGVAIGGTVALSFITGYCFGATMPGHSPSVMLGIVVLFVPGVVIAMRGRMFTTDPDLALDNSVPGLIAAAIAVGCLLNLLLLRRRPLEEPDPALPPTPATAGGKSR